MLEKNRCPFQDVCATIIYWQKEKEQFIREVCDTEEHKSCTHFMGLDANPEWVKEARRRREGIENG